MKWRKEGLIYAPTGKLWWARSYAHLPTAFVLNHEIIRVYFASLDEHRYGRIGYLDLSINNPSKIIDMSVEPILDVGEPGTFDDCGVNPSCIFNFSKKVYMYYIGWQRCERVPYMLFAGLAISGDGREFRKVSRTPILDRTEQEPFLRSATTIIQEEGVLKCWYVSALRWIVVGSRQYPNYIIKYAESQDGVHWYSYDDLCINFESEQEFGFGRPWVIKDKIYKMWYSIRSLREPYRIGYAESQDGKNWVRKDSEVGIERSITGWDSEMICYPCVVSVNKKTIMFYNGNRHGESGFGYAVLEEN